MRQGVDLERARAAKAKALALLADLVEVNGVGITRVGSGYGVKVNLAQVPARGVRLPEEVDGVPVLVELVGPISKRGFPPRQGD